MNHPAMVLPSGRISSSGRHHSSCASSAGVMMLISWCVPFLAAVRTTDHASQVRDAFISQRCSQIPVLCVYEWAASRLISVRVLFGTDEHDHLSSKLITSLTTMGCRTF